MECYIACRLPHDAAMDREISLEQVLRPDKVSPPVHLSGTKLILLHVVLYPWYLHCWCC